jgi:putative sigma-54 modulation protein
MNLSITGRHLEVTEALRNHVKDRFSKTNKYSYKIIDANVRLEIEKYRHIAEIIVQVNGTTLSAKEETEDMYTSIDRALAKIERRLQKHKTKQSDHKNQNNPKTAAKNNEAIRSDKGTVWGEDELQIVKSNRFANKPMSTDEAAMQMRLSDDSFLAFTNARTTEVNVIYRRKDGKLGLIEPER